MAAELRDLRAARAVDDVRVQDVHNPEPGVLFACQDLHMVAMGSMDGVPADEMARLETYLQRKLDGWKDYPAIGSAPGIYDNTVRLLIMTALTEWRACPWNPKNSKAESPPDGAP